MSQPRVAITLLQCWHRVPGGTAAATLAMCRALLDRGEVDLVGVGPWGRSLPEPPWTPPIPVVRLPLPYQAVYEGWHYLGWPSVERRCPDADLVHATAATIPPRGDRPLVVSVYDVFPLSAPEQFTPRGVRLLSRGIELARRHADLVVCPSQATMDDCVAAGFDVGRLRLVPLGVTQHEVTARDRERVRTRYSIDRPYLLWVGTIEPRKNLPTLLEAYRRMGEVEHDLVIVGPPGWGDELESMVLGIGDRVRHLGFVSADDLPAVYDGATAFCFPSLREGFGLPPLEAMSHGVPVVSSAGTASAEVVGDGGLLVDALDVDGWADALTRLLRDGELRARLGSRGRAIASGYGWDRVASRMVDVYREALG